MNKDKEFFEKIGSIVKIAYNKVLDAILATEVKVRSFDFAIDVEEELLKEYGLNKDINLYVNAAAGDVSIKYTYKNIHLSPICVYLRPDDYHEVPTLRILQECIVQDTYKPDIMFLERGEAEWLEEI